MSKKEKVVQKKEEQECDGVLYLSQERDGGNQKEDIEIVGVASFVMPFSHWHQGNRV